VIKVFKGPVVGRRGDERSFWRPCEGIKSKFIVTSWVGKAGIKFMTWIGREVKWLIRDRGG
jgi:hypothetical protein